jgi:hypothetical protein
MLSIELNVVDEHPNKVLLLLHMLSEFEANYSINSAFECFWTFRPRFNPLPLCTGNNDSLQLSFITDKSSSKTRFSVEKKCGHLLIALFVHKILHTGCPNFTTPI